MAVDLSIHTIILHHKISFTEMETLCRKYNISLSKTISIPYEKVMIAGIDNIFIKGKTFCKGGKSNISYDMSVKINAGRLIGDSQYRMLIWSKKNAERFKIRLQGILRNDFLLKNVNTNLDEWFVKRVDCGLDICVPEDACLSIGEYIDYLHEVFRRTQNEKYEYHIFTGYDTNEKRHESIYIDSKNRTHRYNIYDKQKELETKASLCSRKLTEAEISEVDRIIRIEKQVDDFRIIHSGKKTFEYLLDENITEKAMAKIQKELKEIFVDDKDSLYFREMLSMSNGVTRNYSFEDLIKENMSMRIKPNHKAGFGKVALRKDKGRKKRYRANITLHDANGDTFRKAVVARVGQTQEDCERLVFDKINSNAAENITAQKTAEREIEALEYQKSELEAFLTTISIDNKTLKETVNKTICRVQSEIDYRKRILEMPKTLYEMYGITRL